MSDLLVWDTASLLAVSFGIGIIIGLTGMGGGALMTPALIFLGIPPTAAIANDLVAASINKSVGAAVHWRKGSPNLRLAGWLIAGSVPTAFAGAFIVKAIGMRADQEQFLKFAIGGTLLLAAATYVFRMHVVSHRAGPHNANIKEPAVRPLPTLLVGIMGGLLVGVTSVGSGSVMMVILLILYPTMSAKSLVGTDLVQAVPLVIAAAISHALVSGANWMIFLPLIVGGSPGACLGAKIADKVSPPVVRRSIVLILSITGISMLDSNPRTVAIFAVLIVTILGAWRPSLQINDPSAANDFQTRGPGTQAAPE